MAENKLVALFLKNNSNCLPKESKLGQIRKPFFVFIKRCLKYISVKTKMQFSLFSKVLIYSFFSRRNNNKKKRFFLRNAASEKQRDFPLQKVNRQRRAKKKIGKMVARERAKNNDAEIFPRAQKFDIQISRPYSFSYILRKNSFT